VELRWTPYLAVGINTIDNQHKELFDRFNRLMDAIAYGDAKEELASIIVFLGDYVVTHFGTEEKMMDRYSYPSSTAHKAQHAIFVRDFASAKSQLLTSGANIELTADTVNKLAEWLVNHIGRVDKALGGFLKAAMMVRKAA
jgi:hemerythrin